MRRLWLSLCLSALAVFSPRLLALEPDQQRALAQIEARLQTASQMLGRFEQKKTLPQLPRPLLSSGVVALSQEQGVSWRVQQPIASHLILNEQRAGGDALAKQIAYPLLQIFRGNFSALDGLFHVDAEAGEKQWQVRLTPRAETLGKVIASIEISGNNAIEQIRLAESNSAITEMRLLELRAVKDRDPQFTAEFNPAQPEPESQQEKQEH